MTTQIEQLIEKYKERYNNKEGLVAISEVIQNLKSLQPTEEIEVKRVKCWRCNCECGGHNIKGEYTYCPDCGGKIVDYHLLYTY